ncbi:phage tail sheath family protein [Terracidiphilus sp.]|jgi:phage tail sheath protein FI|uniref:phage tail sheath family protein n=1 Tax=Terracidiphilus sp. TaxID=1964191 RepID=UPI003C1A699E
MSAFTYPGVYIEELPSAVHTITGVATSVAAFAGWADQGSITQATLVESWSDFQTQFGGLDSRSLLGYAVNQFFANGGGQAYVVRLVYTDAKTASSTFKIGNLPVYAANPGAWGNNIAITITLNPADATRFSILVQMVSTTGGATATLENFVNLSLSPTDPQGNYFVTVIDSESNYITFIDPLNPGATLTPGTTIAAMSMTQLKSNSGNDGTVLTPNNGNFETALTATGAGVNLLSNVFFNLLCVPGESTPSVVTTLQAFAADPSNRAFYIVDPPSTATYSTLLAGPGAIVTAPNAANSALYFPWVSAPDPLAGNRPKMVPPCGFVAGIYAATDAARGVWKAPAGIDAGLTGINGLQYNLTDQQNGDLNPKAINCLRSFPVYGNIVWGSRTLVGNDQVGSQWKYVPIRRFALFLESSLYQGTQWAVFEPNDDTLWGQLRLNIGAFMQGLFQQGAFQGTTPQQAYFVKCDSENNPQPSIDQGIVNVTVGFAPLYPAEFVVIQIQQMAGQS